MNNFLLNCLTKCCTKKPKNPQKIQIIPEASNNQPISENKDELIKCILFEFNKIPETKLALLFFTATAQYQVSQELLLKLHNSNQPHPRIIFDINELKNPNFCTVKTDKKSLIKSGQKQEPNAISISDEECLKKILEQQTLKHLEKLVLTIPYLKDLITKKPQKLQEKLKILVTELNLSPEKSPQYPYSHGTHLSPAK